jgi:hypothetical protein
MNIHDALGALCASAGFEIKDVVREIHFSVEAL